MFKAFPTIYHHSVTLTSSAFIMHTLAGVPDNFSILVIPQRKKLEAKWIYYLRT